MEPRMPDRTAERKPRILLADDEIPLRDSLTTVLEDEGMQVVSVGDGSHALKEIENQDFDLLISDIRMPGLDGLSLLRSVRDAYPNLSVILITAYASVESAIEAMRLGAVDYILKPLLLDDMLLKVRRVLQVRDLRRENTQLRAEIDQRHRDEAIIGNTQPMRDLLALVDKVAQTRANVLIVGESGTGKELIARAVHSGGVTAKGAFVPVNCGGIPETLFESEMFGHRRGAFTGAVRNKVGLFEAADGGTLFLDEIGNLPNGAQMALLRAIEQKSVTRVGDTRTLNFDLRIVSATNVDPVQLVNEGKFREDLYFRLNVVKLSLPPLHERADDIPLLVTHFIEKYNAEMNRACSGVSEEAMAALQAHRWKGNIRELENVIERALIFAEDRSISTDDLPFDAPGHPEDNGRKAHGSAATGLRDTNDLPDKLDQAARVFERKHIGNILIRCGYDKNRAADALNISLPSLYRKIHDLGLPMQTD
jgi:two-component system response regulator PilR (NtrC family)